MPFETWRWTANGVVFFDTGPENVGLIGTVPPSGQPRLLVTGAAAGADPSEPGSQRRTTAAGAGRLVADERGGVFVATGGRVAHVDSAQMLTTVAGDPALPAGQDGVASSGDGGPVGEARFTSVRSMAGDGNGNLFVADRVDRRTGAVLVRFLNLGAHSVTFYRGTSSERSVGPGRVGTVAGLTGRRNNGDGGPATRAVFVGAPPVLAVEGERLYVGLSPLNRDGAETAAVRMVNMGASTVVAHGVSVAPGAVETVAGRGGPPRGDGGADQLPDLAYLPGIAADREGNLFLADELKHRIRRVDRNGSLTTVVGTGGTRIGDGGFNGNGLRADRSLLNRPFDVAIGPEGSLYVSDQGNGQVRVVDQSGLIRGLPGSGMATESACLPGRGGSGAMATAAAISGVAVDSDGSVYVAASDLHQVKRADPSGVLLAAVGRGGDPEGGFGGDGGPLGSARLDLPTAIAFGQPGALYIFDSGNARVRLANVGPVPVRGHGVVVAPGTIETVLGTGVAGAEGAGGPARLAQIGSLRVEAGGLRAYPRLGLGALAVHDGELFIADPANHRVLRVDDQGTVSIVAGEGATGAAGRCCRAPQSLAVGGLGGLVVGDLSGDDGFATSPRVWLLNPGPEAIVLAGQGVPPDGAGVVAGNGTMGFAGDGGPALDAALGAPTGLVVDATGALFVASVGMQVIDDDRQYVGAVGSIRRVGPDGMVATVAGNGQGTFNGDGLGPLLTSLNFPTGLALDHCGHLLVADLGNDRLRRVGDHQPCAAGVTEPSGAAVEPAVTGSGPSTVLVAAGAVVLIVASIGLLRRRARRGHPGPGLDQGASLAER